MRELYELREKLCKELKKYSGEEITNSSLSVVDSLSHAIKNIDKIIDKNEEEDSYDPSYKSSRDNSYMRGRGRNARRDSMGRYASDGYSRNANLVDELRELMMDAPDEKTRQEYQSVISKLESM